MVVGVVESTSVSCVYPIFDIIQEQTYRDFELANQPAYCMTYRYTVPHVMLRRMSSPSFVTHNFQEGECSTHQVHRPKTMPFWIQKRYTTAPEPSITSAVVDMPMSPFSRASPSFNTSRGVRVSSVKHANGLLSGSRIYPARGSSAVRIHTVRNINGFLRLSRVNAVVSVIIGARNRALRPDSDLPCPRTSISELLHPHFKRI